MPDSLKIRFMRLPHVRKLILVGGFLTTISVFMPWYSDIDKFRIGETFLGISGPMYLAGFFIFVAGLISFGLIMMQLLEKRLPKLPLAETQIHIAGSIVSFLMLIFTVSVYFHPKFGFNLTDKNMGFGMILAFIGSGLVMIAAVLSLKTKGVNFDTEGKIEPLIDLGLQGREKSDLGIKTERQPDFSGKITVGEAMEKYAGKGVGSKSWDMLDVSINNIKIDDRNG